VKPTSIRLRIRNGRARNEILRWLPVFSPHSPPEVNGPGASLYWGRFLIPGFGKMGSNVTALSWPYRRDRAKLNGNVQLR